MTTPRPPKPIPGEPDDFDEDENVTLDEWAPFGPWRLLRVSETEAYLCWDEKLNESLEQVTARVAEKGTKT